ncbi:putative glycosidase crf2 [Smittium mucronatum]|uniref:Putative glycosidase crf2 n=1 Tax=Smittium mucronatum TaxID=133383 RepID=A0A1R0H771_9FUNG|nr:putative glycosidase crf2 [Smittium mucronatum]
MYIFENYVVKYFGGIITIFVENKEVVSLPSSGYNINRLYLAPYVNRANFSKIHLSCKGVDECPASSISENGSSEYKSSELESSEYKSSKDEYSEFDSSKLDSSEHESSEYESFENGSSKSYSSENLSSEYEYSENESSEHEFSEHRSSLTLRSTSTTSLIQTPTPTPRVYLYDFENGSGIRDLIIEYCPKNAVISNGALEMRVDSSCSTDLIYNRRITTGKYETKLKIAKGPGVVTAIDYYGSSKDEINLELPGSSSSNITTMYFAKGVQIDKSPTVITADVDLSLDYHIYSVEILTDAINWYLDGKIIRTLKKTNPNTFPSLAGDKVIFGVWSYSRFGLNIGKPNYLSGPKVAYMKWIKFTHYT